MEILREMALKVNQGKNFFFLPLKISTNTNSLQPYLIFIMLVCSTITVKWVQQQHSLKSLVFKYKSYYFLVSFASTTSEHVEKLLFLSFYFYLNYLEPSLKLSILRKPRTEHSLLFFAQFSVRIFIEYLCLYVSLIFHLNVNELIFILFM